MDRPPRDHAPARTSEPGWGRVLVAGLCRVALSIACSLVVWSVLPAVWGWTPEAIMSGSMTPQILVGDVVVTRHVDVSDLRPGQIITVADPDHPGRTRTHRFLRLDDDGNVVTRGDANTSDDSSHVAPEDVRGVATLRIPYVGRLVVWEAQRDWLALAAVPLTMLVLTLGARMRAPGGARIAPSSRQARHARHRAPTRRRQAGALVAVGVTALTLVGGRADAVFTRVKANPTSTINAGSTFYPYRQAVLADSPYLFWRLSETTGTAVADTTANARAGTISGAPVYSQTPGNLDNKDLALGLGTGTRITQNTSQLAPTTFSVEAWVKTSGTAGGRLVGLGDGSGTTASTVLDCQLYVGTDGKMYFGLGSAKTVVASTGVVNNNAWHHVVGTYVTGASGAKLYVDGVLQASGTATLQSFTGFWRAAAESMTGWTANPTGQFLVGTIDDIAIYTTALTQTQVSAHYAART
jgi:signal peptidase I